MAISLDRINTTAETLDLRGLTRALVTLVSLPFWLAGYLVAYAWFAVRWCVAATITGWDAAQESAAARRAQVTITRE